MDISSQTLEKPTLSAPDNVPPANALPSCSVNGFFQTLSDVLSSPKALYTTMASATTLPDYLLIFSALIVVTVSSLIPFSEVIWKQQPLGALWLSVPSGCLFGLFAWLYSSSLIAGVAYVFNEKNRIKTLLVLTGLSTLPWTLLVPLSLLKISMGPLGDILGFFVGMTLWLWTIALFILALMSTFQIKFDKVLILIWLPFGFSVIASAWTLGFFVKLLRFMP